ncbi:MFS general substrate transporter [Calocera cornea HHB12733]|uniref:MFS general substrate transporter n=1 Tax=Calocera cornea HHB12733 TaxID=1353952 RepID=A0A165I268_9BASI|nr:MFS general substrate transporter [Calocera cornea HHB12733]
MSFSAVPDYRATRGASPTNAEPKPAVEPTPAITTVTISADPDVDVDTPAAGFKKDLGFWIILVSLGVVIWLAALDLSVVSTALPMIVADLPGSTSFVWVGSAFTLASTAILPLSGNLAQLFGRQATLEGFIAIFALGSAITGAAKNMPTMIAGRGRTVQGLGGGGLLALENIIIADLVPLRQRGLYEALLASVWAFASAVGPPMGGALAQAGQWTWIFWINLPPCGVAAVMVWWFLKLRRPRGSWRRKVKRVNWIGNAIVMGAATLAILALTQGGIDHPWASYQILIPLIIGLVGIGVFLVYEAFFVVGEPMVPLSMLTNRTVLSGYLGAFMHGLVSILLLYYLPVFFQSAMLATPLRSSVQSLPTAFIIAPWAIITGISVTVTNHYVFQNIAAWVVCIVGFVLLSTLTKDSTTAQWVGYQVVASTGVGILWSSTEFPVLAPLTTEQNAQALSFFAFVHTAANTFGITIGGAVLQNELRSRLPAAFGQLFPLGVDIAYAAIPQIASLPQPLQDEVRDAFGASLSTLWKVTAGLCGLGLLTSVLMKQVTLATHVAEQWGREEKRDERVPLAPARREQDRAEAEI